jgi:protein O-GlcNAc transferase
VAVDNFSAFDPQANNERALRQHLAQFHIEPQVRFYPQDFGEFFLTLRQARPSTGVYFYDGTHDYRSQLLGLMLVEPFLADRALLIVDDTNCPAVQQANWDFMLAYPACRLLAELPTPRNCSPTFWNGLQILAWDRQQPQHQEWSTFQQKRQTPLLESLHLLQSFHLHAKGKLLQVNRLQP